MIVEEDDIYGNGVKVTRSAKAWLYLASLQLLRPSSRFLDYTGVFMLHCHMMNHEEMGMMRTVEVYKD